MSDLTELLSDNKFPDGYDFYDAIEEMSYDKRAHVNELLDKTKSYPVDRHLSGERKEVLQQIKELHAQTPQAWAELRVVLTDYLAEHPDKADLIVPEILGEPPALPDEI